MTPTRRQFVSSSVLAASAGAAPAWAWALIEEPQAFAPQPSRAQAPGTQAAGPSSISPSLSIDRIAQMRQMGANTPIQVTKLRDTVFMLQGAGGNMVVQIGPDGKLLIDSSFDTAADRIQQALAGLDAHPLKLLLNTHWHFCSTDGNAAQHDAGAFIVAQAKTRLRLSTPQQIEAYGLKFPPAPNSGLPQQTFTDQETLFYNNDRLSLVHFPDAHTDTDIYIQFQNNNVIHTGDLWYNGLYPLIDNGTGGTINGMIRASDQILDIADDKTKIVPGHGPLGDKTALAKYRDMLATVATRVEKLKSGGESLTAVVAAKPTADYDAAWGSTYVTPDLFVTLIYNTLP